MNKREEKQTTDTSADKGDLCLMTIGALYTATSFFIFLQCGGPMGPLGWRFSIIPSMGVLAVIAALIVVGAFCEAKFHWWVALFFGVWIFAVMVIQVWIYGDAAAAV